ncbi:hypothetical protein CPB83DRAFT_901675 [Crepidotus variabilis]|uniref:Uncharacterized protein n=1 Tax=Crepidotus variabilis TaxID=179855 RepID=A0A9P6JUU9_9AGAR|nr:hypothetical protein CPB83DRAFT_901675 [Crepidotus variabilis]
MKLLSAILVFVLAICYIDASPAKSLNEMASTLVTLALQTESSSSLPLIDAHDGDRPPSERSKRTISNILLPCLATLVICSWAAIHPDVSEQKGHGSAIKNRISLTWTMVLSPECVIAWAILQNQTAEAAAQSCQDKYWTQTRGFCLIMGGFVLQNDDGLHALNYQMSTSHIILDGSSRNQETISKIDWSAVSDKEIKDRSKVNLFKKVVMVGISGGFAFKTVYRMSFEKAVPSIEVVTLAYTALIGVIHWFWRNKPFGVEHPIRVYTVDYPRTGVTTIPEDHVTIGQRICKAFSKLGKMKLPSLGPHSWPTIISCAVWGARSIFLDPVSSLMDNGFFFDCNPSNDLAGRRRIVGGAAFLFGAIHGVLSIFIVGSGVEVWMFRAASLGITASPFLLYACFGLERIVGDRKLGKIARQRWLSATTLLKRVIIMLYIVFRVLLIVLPIVDLRRYPALPKGPLNWLELIPPA